MRGLGDTPLSDLATRQDGALGRDQLLALGLTSRTIDYWLATGRLQPRFRGVYTLGHRALTARGHLFAAVLAGGPGAVASHRSAAWLHGLLSTSRSRHDVTVRRHRRQPGIDFHRCKLHPDDVTTVEGIATTTVARTLLDLAEVVPARLVERAVGQAEIRQALDLRAVDAVLGRANGRRGVGTLTAVLAAYRPETSVSRSELEERMLALIRAYDLPAPHMNAQVGPYEVDFLWADRRLIVEVDGAETHLTRRAFEQDRRKDATLAAAGYRVVRFTWRQVVHEPEHVATTLRALLEH